MLSAVGNIISENIPAAGPTRKKDRVFIVIRQLVIPGTRQAGTQVKNNPLSKHGASRQTLYSIAQPSDSIDHELSFDKRWAKGFISTLM